MDDAGIIWHFTDMMDASPRIPVWHLYGERSAFPDLLHIERIVDRASGLDWHIAPHRHLHLHQIFLIRLGTARMTMDGRTATPDGVFVANIPRGVVHGFDFSADAEGFVLTLPVADFPETFGPDAETAPMLGHALHAVVRGDLAARFDEIATLHATEGPFRRLRLRAAALALCCAVAEVAGTGPAAGIAGDPRIATFEALIRRELGSVWPMGRYARELSVSERHLRRLCQTASGLSAQGFVASIRLHEACRLLAYTRMRVQDVGFALGYDDPAYFGRVFQRGMGMSPGAYRARLDL